MAALLKVDGLESGLLNAVDKADLGNVEAGEGRLANSQIESHDMPAKGGHDCRVRRME
jgi:hypothetical protein